MNRGRAADVDFVKGHALLEKFHEGDEVLSQDLHLQDHLKVVAFVVFDGTGLDVRQLTFAHLQRGRMVSLSR